MTTVETPGYLQTSLREEGSFRSDRRGCDDTRWFPSEGAICRGAAVDGSPAFQGRDRTAHNSPCRGATIDRPRVMPGSAMIQSSLRRSISITQFSRLMTRPTGQAVLISRLACRPRAKQSARVIRKTLFQETQDRSRLPADDEGEFMMLKDSGMPATQPFEALDLPVPMSCRSFLNSPVTIIRYFNGKRLN